MCNEHDEMKPYHYISAHRHAADVRPWQGPGAAGRRGLAGTLQGAQHQRRDALPVFLQPHESDDFMPLRSQASVCIDCRHGAL